MTTGSRVNPNFPIPGIDQSSRGFRDKFAIIEREIEQIQGKHIQLTGVLVSDPMEIGNGTGDVVIQVNVSRANVQASCGMAPRNQLDAQGNAYVSGSPRVGTTPAIRGSRGANAALASLLTAPQAMSLIVDNTTA